MAKTMANSELRDAIKNGDFSAVKKLIEGGLDCNAAVCGDVETKNTPLMIAVACDQLDIAKYLIEERKVDVNKANADGKIPMHVAAFNGNFEMSKLLVNNGADTNIGMPCYFDYLKGYEHVHDALIKFLKERNIDLSNGCNLGGSLHIASRTGSLEICKLLVDNGADYKCVDELKRMPVFYAALFNHPKIVKYFIEMEGIDVNHRDVEDAPLLTTVASHCDVDTLKLVMEKGADPEPIDYYGDTLLHSASRWGNHDVVKYLIETGKYDLHERNNKMHTALQVACQSSGNVETVRLLVNKGSKYLLSKKEDKPVHIAAINGQLEIVKYFFEEKNLNIKQYDGNGGPYLLCYAGGADNVELIKYLIDKGANVNAVDEHGYSPFHSAIEAGCTNVVKFFLEKKLFDVNVCTEHKANYMHMVAGSSFIKIVELMADHGADPKARDVFGNTYLHQAAMNNGDVKVIKFLMDKYNFDVNEPNYRGMTPLLFACEWTGLETVKFLVDLGADVTAEDNNGDTALHRACSKANVEVAKYLIDEKGLDINKPNKMGQTPLYMAAHFGDLEFFKFLITKGADYKVVTLVGSNCADVARLSGHAKIVQFLAEKNIRGTLFGQVPGAPAMGNGENFLMSLFAMLNSND